MNRRNARLGKKGEKLNNFSNECDCKTKQSITNTWTVYTPFDMVLKRRIDI